MKKEILDKLTWKYFWIQKIQEVSLAVLIILMIVGLYFLASSNPETLEKFADIGCKVLLYIVMVILILLMTFMIGGLIYLIIRGWLEANWDKAERRAKKELKIK